MRLLFNSYVPRLSITIWIHKNCELTAAEQDSVGFTLGMAELKEGRTFGAPFGQERVVRRESLRGEKKGAREEKDRREVGNER